MGLTPGWCLPQCRCFRAKRVGFAGAPSRNNEAHSSIDSVFQSRSNCRDSRRDSMPCFVAETRVPVRRARREACRGQNRRDRMRIQRSAGVSNPTFRRLRTKSGKHIGNGAAQNPFGSGAAKSEIRIDFEGEADQARVGERNTRLQTACHAHPIVLMEQTSEVGLEIPMHDLIHRLGGGRAGDHIVKKRPAAVPRIELRARGFRAKSCSGHLGEVLEITGFPVQPGGAHFWQDGKGCRLR